ncbi:MAG: amidohydrolase [Acidobacteria bacterium]|nr:MAG: amidohydrolase [Acidobacteriota bacterium]
MFRLPSTVVLILALTAPALAQPAALDTLIEEVTPRIVELRHRIHQNPELGNREHRTAALVAEHLRSLGIEDVRTGVAHTGVVAVIRGGRPGPVVAVRADMDALPVTEATDLPFKSTVRTEYLGQEVGVSHACGHDVHTAVQLGVASVLAALREELPGTVKLIFQPAEEGPPPGEEGGAELMLAEGAFDDPRPEAVFGLHTFSEMEVGRVGYTVGPAFAAVDHFYVEIHGVQSHGAYPHQGIDPIVMAAQAVMALQTIRSRNLDPLQPSVVSVGIIRGGERFNIIPSTVHLEGTVRTYDPAVRDAVERRMGEILDGIARAAGGSYELNYERGSPATINDPELTRRVAPSLVRAVGEDHVDLLPPTMGGEDFAYFANAVPGFYFRLGMVKPGTTSGGHHTPTFTADDGAIPVGIRAMVTLILDYLAGTGS